MIVQIAALIVGGTLGSFVGNLAYRWRQKDTLIPEVRYLTLNPDDRVVIRLNHSPNSQCATRIVEQMKELFPDHKVMILGSDTDFSIARSAELEGKQGPPPPPPPTPGLGRPETKPTRWFAWL